MKMRVYSLPIFMALVLFISSCTFTGVTYDNISLDEVDEYSGKAYVVLNGNVPNFTEADFADKSYEEYSPLDYLGRCGAAVALVGQDIMPTEERTSISHIKPTGWHSVKYDWVDGKSLYNRCHLIGFQLAGENANERNLITGTRYMNVEGMLPFENMVADYVKETDNHVLLRVTPVYDGKNLLASGVVMEAMSMEDKGEDICFNVYCYNVQPGVSIDYATGESKAESAQSKSTSKDTQSGGEYILNINSKKIHTPNCPNVKDIKEKNRGNYSGTIDALLKDGYSTCKSCNPQ